MKKTHVRICTGTTCFIMGASHLQRIEDDLPEDLAARVHIEASHCLGSCNDPEAGRPPFVMVDDTLITEATLDTLIEAIRKAQQRTM